MQNHCPFHPPKPQSSLETDTKAIMAQIKYLKSCQRAMGEYKSLGVVKKNKNTMVGS